MPRIYMQIAILALELGRTLEAFSKPDAFALLIESRYRSFSQDMFLKPGTSFSSSFLYATSFVRDFLIRGRHRERRHGTSIVCTGETFNSSMEDSFCSTYDERKNLSLERTKAPRAFFFRRTISREGKVPIYLGGVKLVDCWREKYFSVERTKSILCARFNCGFSLLSRL